MLKRYYCSNCHRFKNRLQIKRKYIGHETYWFICKRCRKYVEYSDAMIERLEETVSELKRIKKK